MPPARGEIQFDGVTFAYNPGTDILHDISFTVKPGETVAIAGRTGAGKSSMTSLIARFYEATSGRVLIDGHDITAVTQESLRRQIAIVPQDPFLFSGHDRGQRALRPSRRHARGGRSTRSKPPAPPISSSASSTATIRRWASGAAT